MIILYILLALVALVLLVGMVAKKDFAVERFIDISSPKRTVFDFLRLVKNQDHFGVWQQKDPKMKSTSRGVDGQVGFVNRWESEHKQVGFGEQEIKKIVEGERIDTELRFEKPMKAVNQSYFIVESIGENKTRVRWGFTGRMAFPLNVLMLLMNFEKAISKDFDEGLSNLKKHLEK